MANFCPWCGAHVGDMSPAPKFCPKCGRPLSAAAAEPSVPAQSSAVSAQIQSPVCDLSDLPSRLQYIIAMVCLAVSIGAMILFNSMLDGEEQLSVGKMVAIALVNAAALIWPCVVIKKMLPVKRKTIGLWAVRVFYVISVAIAFFPILFFGMAKECQDMEDVLALMQILKTGGVCLLVVYTAALAALGFALTDLKDHAAGGRWFAGVGIALILCAILLLISGIYDFANFEEQMMSDEPDSWLSAVQLESIVLFVLFIVGYMFMPGDDL